MNYADAIVYLKENNITKEDGTFYEFGEVCVIASAFWEKWSDILGYA